MLKRFFSRAAGPPPSYDLAEMQAAAASGRKLVIYDRATGLYAYWYLELRSEEEISRARRYGKPLSCLSIWAPSPQLAERVTKQLKDGLREHDLAAYLNNGHFAAILAETDRDGATVVARRLAERAGREVLIGVAVFPEDAQAFDGLLEHAKSAAAAIAA